MGIEATESALVVSGAEAIKVYDVIAFRSALRLEILGNGMRFSNRVRLVPQAIRRGYVTEGTRSKRKAYIQLDSLAVSLGAKSHPLPTPVTAQPAE